MKRLSTPARLLSNLVHAHCKRTGCPISEVSAAIGVSASQLSQWMMRPPPRLIPLEHVAKVCEVLGASDEDRELLMRARAKARGRRSPEYLAYELGRREASAATSTPIVNLFKSVLGEVQSARPDLARVGLDESIARQRFAYWLMALYQESAQTAAEGAQEEARVQNSRREWFEPTGRERHSAWEAARRVAGGAPAMIEGGADISRSGASSCKTSPKARRNSRKHP